MSNNFPLQYRGDLVAVGSAEAYIHGVNQIPLLSQEEELALAIQLQETADVGAAKKLVLAHLRYVVRIAYGYLGYGLSLMDLIQEGNIGLMKAVKRFDPKVGVRLASFAVHWIKSEMHEFIIRNWRIVKIATTKAQRKLFFNLRQMKKGLNWMTKEEAQFIADDLKVTTDEVFHMEARLNQSDMPLEGSSDSEGEDSSAFFPIHYLEDKHADPLRQLSEQDWSEQGRDHLLAALDTLDERSRHILTVRWLNEEKTTLQALAAHYGISLERIRQVEKNAMNKLKATLIAFSNTQ